MSSMNAACQKLNGIESDPRKHLKEQNKLLGDASGPNIGGKSTLLRQVCLAVILAQVIGADVPAESFELSPIDRIFVQMGAKDHIMAGHSTFLTELLDCFYTGSYFYSRDLPRPFTMLMESSTSLRTSAFNGYDMDININVLECFLCIFLCSYIYIFWYFHVRMKMAPSFSRTRAHSIFRMKQLVIDNQKHKITRFCAKVVLARREQRE
ncbi:uncharacterized protein [Henckelia pumila]|uniref:uncharacterized protein n=1 Tax=Henckelia pumila TaxID=405737 RepID=UPI003C6E6580